MGIHGPVTQTYIQMYPEKFPVNRGERRMQTYADESMNGIYTGRSSGCRRADQKSFPAGDLMSTTCTGQEIRISVAEPGDLEQILALQKIAFLSEAALIDDYSIPPLHQDIAEIRDEFRRNRFLKAETGGRIVGSVRAGVQGGTCLIQKLIVQPGVPEPWDRFPAPRGHRAEFPRRREV